MQATRYRLMHASAANQSHQPPPQAGETLDRVLVGEPEQQSTDTNPPRYPQQEQQNGQTGDVEVVVNWDVVAAESVAREGTAQ